MPRQNVPGAGVVVDDQHAQADQLDLRRRVTSATPPTTAASRTVNQNVEPCPARCRRRSRRPSASTSCLQIAKPEARCRRICAWSNASAWLKGWKMSPWLRRDADAGVASPRIADSIDRRRSGLDPHRSHLAVLGELDRVADQVDQDLAQPHRVAAHAWPGRRGRHRQASSSPLRVRARREQISTTLLDDVAQVEIDVLRAPACRLRSSRSRGCR